MTENKNAIVVFAKAPIPGRVKTRLCPPLSPLQAAELYRAFAQDVLDCAGRVSTAQLYIAYDDCGSGDPPDRILGRSRVDYFLQKGMDLGERLTHAFDRVFRAGTERAIIIGSDIPQIEPEIIRHALDSLSRSDVVLGPAKDGGYYLIGLKKRRPELLQGIPWSTHEVFEATMTRAWRAGLKVSPLAPLADMDTFEDILTLTKELRLWPKSVCPATRSVLKSRILKEAFDEINSL